MPLAGDHCGVVGAVIHIGAAEADAAFIAGPLEPFAQGGIRGNAPRESECGKPGLPRGADRLFSQRFGDSPLERGGEVGAVDRFPLLLGVVQYVHDGGLEAGERKIEALALVKGRVERVGFGVAVLRQLLELRPAGVGEAHRAGDLIECLARRVVAGAPDEREIGIPVHADDMAVSAGGDNAHERRLKIGICDIVCGDMPGDVVDAYERQILRVGEPLCV